MRLLVAALSSLLLAGGSVRALAGTDDLARTGHLYRVAPWLAAAFLLQALSLAGLPPLSGFWGKLLLFKASVGAGAWTVLALAAAAGSTIDRDPLDRSGDRAMARAGLLDDAVPLDCGAVRVVDG